MNKTKQHELKNSGFLVAQEHCKVAPRNAHLLGIVSLSTTTVVGIPQLLYMSIHGKA